MAASRKRAFPAPVPAPAPGPLTPADGAAPAACPRPDWTAVVTGAAAGSGAGGTPGRGGATDVGPFAAASAPIAVVTPAAGGGIRGTYGGAAAVPLYELDDAPGSFGLRTEAFDAAAARLVGRGGGAVSMSAKDICSQHLPPISYSPPYFPLPLFLPHPSPPPAPGE